MRMSSEARTSLAWGALIVITLFASWLAAQSSHDGALEPNAAVSLGVMAIAAIKVRLIFREFMDVRNAPARLRYLTDAWLGLFIAAAVAAYLIGGGI